MITTAIFTVRISLTAVTTNKGGDKDNNNINITTNNKTDNDIL